VTYLVAMHRTGQSALVLRMDMPRCTVEFVRRGDAWSAAGPLWIEGPSDAGLADRVVQEAGKAFEDALDAFTPGGGPSPGPRAPARAP
jgi:hypothetical protein